MTMRATSSAAVFGVVAVGALLFVGDALARGSWDVAARAAGPAAVVVWIAWLLLVRPSIRVESGRAVVVNVGRVTDVPWARVVDVRRRLQLILDLDDGTSVEAWGSPFVSRRTAEQEDAGLTALRAAWHGAAEGEGAVSRRPDILAFAVGAAAVLCAAVSLGVAR